MRIKTSVIIPTYNRCILLKRALKSVIYQSKKPDEIIVVDDGSTDKTEIMVKENFSNIKYFFIKNKGVSSARNFGILKSKNEWISFLDSDDEWHKEKHRKQISFIQNNKYCKFLHTNEKWIKNGVFKNQKFKHLKKGGDIFEECLKLCCISASSVILKKSIFKDYGMFDENFDVCEDYELWLRISAKEKVYFLEDELIFKHGGHLGQLSKKNWGMDRFRVNAIEKNIKNNFFDKNQISVAINYLQKKINIIIIGAIKRNNKKIFDDFFKKKLFWNNFNF